MSRAQGQFTIIDYNDAITLTGYIGANLAKTQMYNPDNDSYEPDWTSTNMVLTPQLFLAGSATDIITNSAVDQVKWYEGSSSSAITAGATYGLSGTKNHILTIKQNTLANVSGKDYKCVVTYIDPTTNLTLTYAMSISLSRVVNGGGIGDLILTTPNGNIFKNGQSSSLTAVGKVWQGSTDDTANCTFKWAIMDPSVTSSSSAGYDADFGTGWRLLSNTSGMYTGCTTETLTVYAAAVDSFAAFQCCAITSGGVKYFDTATFVDMSDPWQVIISSTGGDVFKNGVGSTTLRANVYQAGEEIDSTSPYTLNYYWCKYNKNNVRDTNWGTGGIKTGKELPVGDTDVDVKSTYMVLVSDETIQNPWPTS